MCVNCRWTRFWRYLKTMKENLLVFFQHQWEQGRLRHSLKERNLQLQFDGETSSNSGVSAKLSMDVFEVSYKCYYMMGHEMAES